MAGAKENPCRKFQANIFNKSKCQNCFKPRELHLLTDQDLNQAKPIYGGWLCLAPEGTDFDNPMQRSRKWQRRFFVLYEHGCLRFALDESPSTLPQGTVNMNQCTDIIDAEPKTGQKNALCIVTPEREYFIRGESKEIINGWLEQLAVYPKTNKQNQKKKRKVEPTTSQEPGPAKVAVTGSGIPDSEKVPDSRTGIWQDEGGQSWPSPESSGLSTVLAQGGELGPLDVTSDHSSVNGDEVDRGGVPFHVSQRHDLHVVSPAGSASSKHSMDLGGIPRCQSPAQSDPFPSGSSLLSNGSHISGSMSSLDSDTSGSTVTSTDSHYAEIRAQRTSALQDVSRSRKCEMETRKAEKRSRARSPERHDVEAAFGPERSRPTVIEKFEALELENAERMETEDNSRPVESRQGRSETRRFQPETETKRDYPRSPLCSTIPPLRRAKSLDRRTTESIMTPDLLNFKKGWMVKLDDHGQWKKYWFVLTDHSLRYYKDSIAEDASDLDGEIDLTTCYNVTEYQVQRNYGFQIYTQEAVYTLSAMTAGIRRNWIQAVMKNVRPSTAPDVASLPTEHGGSTPLDAMLKPDVTQDSPSSEASSVEREPGQKKSRVRERRKEGRSKTFDWAEFRPIAQALAQQRAYETEPFNRDSLDFDRTRRREERRKRYEVVTGTMDSSSPEITRAEFGSCSTPVPADRQQKVQDEIEQQWQQVEKTPIREDRHIPLASAFQSTETVELGRLLENHKKMVEELQAQLENCHRQLVESNQRKQELEMELRSAMEREQQVRAGYISPLDSPLGLHAELETQKQQQELISSQAQSLKKKYQETKEILQQQEIKKRSMQAQLGLALGETPDREEMARTLGVELDDCEENLREVQSLLSEKPMSLWDLARLLASKDACRLQEKGPMLRLANESGSRCVASEKGVLEFCRGCQNLHEAEVKALKHLLTKAEEQAEEFKGRLEDMEGVLSRPPQPKTGCPTRPMEEHMEFSEVTVKQLAQDVELLTNENEVLHQRCQEIVNQLTEADREIERLKAELFSWQGGQQHLQVVEELSKVKAKLAESKADLLDREFYEKELNKKSQKLQEALINLEVLESSLKETERKLHLKEATLQGLGFQLAGHDDTQQLLEDQQRLRLQLEAAEAKLAKQEGRLKSMELSFSELQAQNQELKLQNKEVENFYRQKLLEAERKSERAIEGCYGKGTVQSEISDERKIKCVIEKMKLEASALQSVVEHVQKTELCSEKLQDDSVGVAQTEGLQKYKSVLRTLQVERDFWFRLSSVANKSTCEGADGVMASSFLSKLAESKLLKLKMLLLTGRLGHIPEASLPKRDPQLGTSRVCASVSDGQQGKTMEEAGKFVDGQSCADWWDQRVLSEVLQNLQVKAFLLSEIASGIEAFSDDELMSLALNLTDVLDSLPEFHYHVKSTEESWAFVLQDATMQALVQYAMSCLEALQNDLRVKVQPSHLEVTREDVKGEGESPKSQNDDMMRIQIDGEPIDSLDKAIEMQDMAAKHKKELREVKDAYESEIENLRREVAKAEEILRLKLEENVKEIDSLTICMENLKKKHELEMQKRQEQYVVEKRRMEEAYVREIERLRKEAEERVPDLAKRVTFEIGAPEEDSEMVEAEEACDGGHSVPLLRERIEELESQIDAMRDEMKRRECDGDLASIQQKYEKDLENLKATCERGFAAMEESHQKVIEELQRKHQRELEKLRDEKERLLEEETAATIAAIEAMKNAHRMELEKELEKARKANSNTENADIEEIRRQHEEELASFQREIEVLSEQYSQKCLENAHLAQALEAERQALRQCQRENQELNAHNQELNNRLAAEITRLRLMVTNEDGGDSCTLVQGKEVYELEVMLRVKESEVQYLKQEINSLKDELQTAQRDKKYATDKYKDIYTELSIVKAKSERDLNRLKEQLQLAHEALGEQALEDVERSGYDIMKSKSNPDILKMAAAAAKRSERTMRSKSLKEGLTAEQRLQLFDKDTKDF
ncbi:myosin phosphatase Rho-interacting protein [Polypterus senegalus]|uniref:myosin phosphatase Rho-interacting protein n=1 Tax=Polypterus senegalus TaxID=55291 RepID=UPI001964E95B|nr:myosin phosphatase Rho-interacting protein [Polypterus senegalus]